MKISIVFILVIYYAAFAADEVTGFPYVSNILDDIFDIIGILKEPKPKPYNNTAMYNIHQQWKKIVAPYVTECMCETRAKLGIINKFYDDGEMSNDSSFKCQLKCYGTKLSIMYPSGTIDAERWADVFDLSLDLAQKCTSISNSEPNLCERAFLAVKCVDDALSEQHPA